MKKIVLLSLMMISQWMISQTKDTSKVLKEVEVVSIRATQITPVTQTKG